MRRFNDKMLGGVDPFFFHLSMPSPQNKDNRPLSFTQHVNNSVRQSLPAFSLMGIRLSAPYCQHSIQQKNALLCPAHKRPVIRDAAPDVLLQLKKDIF